MKSYTITFQPDDVKVRIAPNSTIMDAAQRAGIIINNVCGQAGTCQKCSVKISAQKEPVLACQYQIQQDLIVNIPERSRFYEQKILEQGISPQERIEPMISKHHLVIEETGLKNITDESRRLVDAIEQKINASARSAGVLSKYSFHESLRKQLPKKLSRYHHNVTAVCHEQHIIALEKGNTTERLLGVAVDIGTTTVVAQLVDLLSGKDLAVASRTNPQVRFGDDVISRIRFAETHQNHPQQLQHSIIDCINELIGQLCEKSNSPPKNIYELTATGNTTMQHLLLKVPVAQLAQAPYVTAFSGPVNTTAFELGIDIHPEGNIYVMPLVASHVGGDTVAVALATGMRYSDKNHLALDIGTNGELIMGNKDRLAACSTAAGPAFEGARIEHGMRAAGGAIERVNIDDDVEISVIDGGPPTGICGSGLIDAVAELLKLGIIDKTGRLLNQKELPAQINQKIKQRMLQKDGNPVFILTPAPQTSNGPNIGLTQKDIREVQLAKAAIRAGMTILMNHLHIEWSDVERIYLAGAFGNYIDPASAQRIGLLPRVERSKIMPVGNAAGVGVRQVLLARSARRRAEKLAREIEYVELAGQTEFEKLFSENIYFPEE